MVVVESVVGEPDDRLSDLVNRYALIVRGIATVTTRGDLADEASQYSCWWQKKPSLHSNSIAA